MVDSGFLDSAVDSSLDFVLRLSLSFYSLESVRRTVVDFKENGFVISFDVAEDFVFVKFEESGSSEEVELIKWEFVSYLNYVEFESLKGVSDDD